MQGNITALYDIGCVVGSIVCYFVGERLGRRTMLISGGGIMIVGAIILATSETVAQLIVGTESLSKYNLYPGQQLI